MGFILGISDSQKKRGEHCRVYWRSPQHSVTSPNHDLVVRGSCFTDWSNPHISTGISSGPSGPSPFGNGVLEWIWLEVKQRKRPYITALKDGVLRPRIVKMGFPEAIPQYTDRSNIYNFPLFLSCKQSKYWFPLTLLIVSYLAPFFPFPLLIF